jgi:uncharacterized membrane protein
MAPLIVMVVGWLLFRWLGGAGWLESGTTWTGALRLALALMFAFTAIAHFLPRTRPDLIRMVPPSFPNPGTLVTITGVLELAGAVGLLVPALASVAAFALIAFLVAVFPANIHAARQRILVAGRLATPLVVRVPLQIFWIAALWWVARMPAGHA